MVSCIVLAAGESKRFGNAPKPLALLNTNYTVIEHIQAALAATLVAEVIIVLGYDAHRIIPRIAQNKKIRYVVNENYLEGQASSLKTGLRAISTSATAIMLLPVDVPLIKKETFDKLVNVFESHKPLLLIPRHKEKYGHPPIFNASLKEELLALQNSQPISTLQHTHHKDILDVPTDDAGVVISFNTRQEFEEVKKAYYCLFPR